MPKDKQRKETRKKGKRTEEGSCCSVLNFFHPSPLVGWDFLLLPPSFSLLLVPSHRREDFWFINDGFGFVRVSNLSRRHRASITAPILTHPLPGYLLRLSPPCIPSQRHHFLLGLPWKTRENLRMRVRFGGRGEKEGRKLVNRDVSWKMGGGVFIVELE